MMITEYGADAYDNSNQREWQNDEQRLGDRWRGPGLTSLQVDHLGQLTYSHPLLWEQKSLKKAKCIDDTHEPVGGLEHV